MKNYIKDMSTKRFWIYQLRWQISAVVMILPMMFLTNLGLPLWLTLSLGQLFGAFVFWKIDKLIFKNHKTDNVEDTINDTIGVMVSERKV